MFEAGFTCILNKSLMNTRTTKKPYNSMFFEFIRFFIFAIKLAFLTNF